jgi:TatA/E family protein of Tat protein translocase
MNVLGMGPLELMLIVVLALIVFGPAKLPEIMGQIGRAIGDFRRATSELSDEFNRTIQSELQETRAIVEETREVMQETRSAVQEAHAAVGEARQSVTTLPAPTRVETPPPPAPPPAAEPPYVNGTDTAASDVPASPVVSNGGVEPTPALADTTQWSWETAALPTDREPEPEPMAAPEPAPPAPSPAKASADRARDELAPPY